MRLDGHKPKPLRGSRETDKQEEDGISMETRFEVGRRYYISVHDFKTTDMIEVIRRGNVFVTIARVYRWESGYVTDMTSQERCKINGNLQEWINAPYVRAADAV